MEHPLSSSGASLCPQCKAFLPEHHGFVTWCDQCDWNVDPSVKEPLSLYERLYRKAGRASGRRTLAALIKNGELKPVFSLRRLIMYFLCAVVHLISLVLMLAGLYVLYTTRLSLVPAVLGSLLLLLAWMTRPRFHRMKDTPLSREEFPVTYQVVDEIAASLNARSVSGIVPWAAYNAAFGQYGPRRKSYLFLGIPLLSVLNKQEWVALLSHEIGHGMNGDPNRGLFFNSAINTLTVWHSIIRPERILGSDGYSFTILFMIPVNLMLLLLSKGVHLFLALLCHLNWLDSQRAEFLADRIAVEGAGKEAKLGLLHKLSLNSLFEFCVRKTINTRNTSPLLDEFARQAAALPEREHERLRRAARLEGSCLDNTHPPTADRIAFMESLPDREPAYRLSDDQFRRMKRELFSMQGDVERLILEDYRSNVLGY
ncbi:M48 family metallopeptidase [Gorillibacterium sp. CAU 1737]|uniref:M48 family metallopeptidase n=1 Tax=Gorillibacterium sp. CAU 1737 TaxID=3140362 RepID=UPI0032609925